MNTSYHTQKNGGFAPKAISLETSKPGKINESGKSLFRGTEMKAISKEIIYREELRKALMYLQEQTFANEPTYWAEKKVKEAKEALESIGVDI